MTLKEKIQDEILKAVELGAFHPVTYEAPTGGQLFDRMTVDELTIVKPFSAEANEIAYHPDEPKSKLGSWRQELRRTDWELHMAFGEHVAGEKFISSFARIVPAEGSLPAVKLYIAEAEALHPPREGSDNGTYIRCVIRAEALPT